MAARAQAAGRAGGRFAQFKLVLLGEIATSSPWTIADVFQVNPQSVKSVKMDPDNLNAENAH